MEPMGNAYRLSDHERRAARRLLQDFGLRNASEADLLAELDKRRNDIARYRADLEDGLGADGAPDWLAAGIAYDLAQLEAITHELERRERAAAFGYRRSPEQPEDDLRARFDQAKLIDLVELIRRETGQGGSKSGGTWKFACPFHAGGAERTPSLVAYPDGHFHCFGCGVHGADPAAFLAEMRCIPQVEALRMLESGVLGMEVPA